MDLFSHGLISWGICRLLGLPDWMFIFGVLPDIDGFAAIFGLKALEKYHRAILHNFLFVIIISVPILFFDYNLFIPAVILTTFHLLLDFLTGKEIYSQKFKVRVQGPRIFWPFSNKPYSLKLTQNVHWSHFIIAFIFAILVYILKI